MLKMNLNRMASLNLAYKPTILSFIVNLSRMFFDDTLKKIYYTILIPGPTT